MTVKNTFGGWIEDNVLNGNVIASETAMAFPWWGGINMGEDIEYKRK